MAEAEELETVERERAERRRLSNLKRGEEKPEVEMLPPREYGKTRDKVAAALLNSIVTDVLGLAKKHQTGRVTEKVTNVTFTEGWFRPMDLFDWLDVIGRLRGEGLTQAEIGERVGWSESKVKQYSALLTSVVTNVLDIAKQHQLGRVTEEVTTGNNFTERWFRDSGLYALCEKYQLRLMEGFITDKCRWSNGAGSPLP